MALSEAQPKTIDGRARTVRELLDKAKYAIDFYQREYAWQERQVRELLDDLTGKFLDSYEPGHSRHEVEGYDHYFLGSIVISHKRGQRFVVDGTATPYNADAPADPLAPPSGKTETNASRFRIWSIPKSSVARASISTFPSGSR